MVLCLTRCVLQKRVLYQFNKSFIDQAPSVNLLNSVSVYKHRYILTKQAWTTTLVNLRHYRIVCCAYSNSIEGACLLHYYA